MWSAVKAPGFSSDPHPVVMPFTQVASSIQKINIWCFYWLYPILCCCWIMLYYGGGMTYYLILYILFDNHLIRLRECLGKWTTSLVWMWCGTSWNGYKMIQTLGHLTVSLWTQHPVFQKNIFCDVRHGKVFPAAWLNSLWQSHPAGAIPHGCVSFSD